MNTPHTHEGIDPVKMIPVENQWRYSPEERAQMIRAGYRFEIREVIEEKHGYDPYLANNNTNSFV